jgi:hypothetical protein
MVIERVKSCDMHTQVSKRKTVQNTQDFMLDDVIIGVTCFS